MASFKKASDDSLVFQLTKPKNSSTTRVSCLAFIKSMSTRNFQEISTPPKWQETPGQRQQLKLPSSEPKLRPPCGNLCVGPRFGDLWMALQFDFGAVFGEFYNPWLNKNIPVIRSQQIVGKAPTVTVNPVRSMSITTILILPQKC